MVHVCDSTSVLVVVVVDVTVMSWALVTTDVVPTVLVEVAVTKEVK